MVWREGGKFSRLQAGHIRRKRPRQVSRASIQAYTEIAHN